MTSGKRSITSRLVDDRTTRVAGLGLRTTFLFSVMTIVVSCSPGSLPDGFAGAGGGAGGAGGSGPPPTVTENTPVANCSKFTTLGLADAWFTMRCGFNGACHGNGAPWTDMTQAPLWMKLQNKKPIVACSGGSAKLIDTTDWMKSYLFIKTSQMAPACPSGGIAPGTIMPPPDAMQALPAGVAHAAPLAADELTCVAQFAQAAAGQ